MTTELLTIGLSRWTLAIGLLAAFVLTLGGLQSGIANADVGDNEAPDCSKATPSIDVIEKNNKKFVPVNLLGVTDPDGDDVTITVFAIRQDEEVGKKSPDGLGVGTDTAQVRAERDGKGNGRFYHITFEASDGNGGASICATLVTVSVPKGKKTAVDGGPLDDSTKSQ